MKIELTVTYLVRYKDLDNYNKFENFLFSYLNFNSGVAHKLLIIFKGFKKEKLKKYFQFLKKKKIKYQFLKVQDKNDYDLGTYKNTMKFINTKYVFFLNSSSKILCNNWLLFFYTGIKFKDVFVVGATASCEKITLFKDIKFPNPHIRTNAFIIKTDIISNLLNKFNFNSKIDCWRFESGKNSMFRKLNKKDYSCLVVGRDFHYYTPDFWFISNTFKSGIQENLIISDNQTETYMKSNIELKRNLSIKAWDRVDMYNYY